MGSGSLDLLGKITFNTSIHLLKMNLFKKITKTILVLVVLIFLIGFVSVFTMRFVMPWLSSKENLQRFKFFQKANEEVTIINKTEQITVKENYNVSATAENILPSVVSIITFNNQINNSDSIAKTIKSSEDIKQNIKTGIIITSDGLIVSVMDEVLQGNLYENNIADNKFKILMDSGREFDAQLKAIDPYSNLVFYKIDATNLHVPPFGNSDELAAGEKIVICGNATGEYQNTFSLGVIEKKDRSFTLLNSELSSSEKMEGAIITDAVIGYSNRGGAVVDYNGTLVGIANQAEKDGLQSGFVMPINKIKKIVDLVMEKGEIKRPALGVYYLSIDREIALLNNLPVNQGALIYSFTGQQGLAVIKGSAAEKAGLKLGDIITEVSGIKVDLDNPLSSLIAQHDIGDKIDLKIIRADKEQRLEIVLQ
jgi:serine protease Do